MLKRVVAFSVKEWAEVTYLLTQATMQDIPRCRAEEFRVQRGVGAEEVLGFSVSESETSNLRSESAKTHI